MFTGLVAAVGKVGAIERGADSAVFRFEVSDFLAEVKIGDSISVNGVCLTAVELGVDFFTRASRTCLRSPRWSHCSRACRWHRNGFGNYSR